MKKKFNVTGVCYPHLHYMMDNVEKMKEIMEMIKGGDYFIINRPRQYGKTTTLFFIETALNKTKDYVPIRLNFQGVDSQSFESDGAFAKMIFGQISNCLEFQQAELIPFLKEIEAVVDIRTLSKFITRLVHKLNKKIVLMIDEVDASSEYLPFLNFLGNLRTKYLERFSAQHATFHSIVLVGVHDVKTLKQKIRAPKDSTYYSPWNIVMDFKVRMSFSPSEIEPMLREYSMAENVQIDIPFIAERLYYHTAGYPFLVSKLCKIVAEDLLPLKQKKHWKLADIDKAVLLLLKETNTNFDSLIKNLENNSNLYQLVYRILIEGERIPANPHEPNMSLGRLYGIFKLNGHLKIHNRIYEQCIYDYMITKNIVEASSGKNYAAHFLLENNQLDMKAILLKFQQLMKEEYSLKNNDFLEAQGRLIFLSFLTPILNGQGYAFKEVQTSLEKRLDIVVTYFQHRYIIELKKWYGQVAHEKGLDQLADYLDIHGVSTGYLLIFDSRKNRDWKQSSVKHKGKNIFMVWV